MQIRGKAVSLQSNTVPKCCKVGGYPLMIKTYPRLTAISVPDCVIFFLSSAKIQHNVGKSYIMPEIITLFNK